MKSSAAICDLNVISVNEGKKICKIRDIIIDYHKGNLAFFLIEQPVDYLGAKLISFHDIIGMGDYAVTIPDSKVIQDVAHCALAEELIVKDVKIIGSQVLTNKGSLIGEAADIYFDEASGKIKVCQVKNPQGEMLEVNCAYVITYGKEMIIVDEKALGKQPLETEQQNQEIDLVQYEKEVLKKKIEAFSKSDHLLKTYGEKAEEQNDNLDLAGDFNVFEQKQLQFLVGKSLVKDVELDNGQLLKAGEEISSSTLQEIKSKKMLMQLTAHVVK